MHCRAHAATVRPSAPPPPSHTHSGTDRDATTPSHCRVVLCGRFCGCFVLAESGEGENNEDDALHRFFASHPNQSLARRIPGHARLKPSRCGPARLWAFPARFEKRPCLWWRVARRFSNISCLGVEPLPIPCVLSIADGRLTIPPSGTAVEQAGPTTIPTTSSSTSTRE